MQESHDIDLTLIQSPSETAAPSSSAGDSALFSLHEERYALQDLLGQGAMGEIGAIE